MAQKYKLYGTVSNGVDGVNIELDCDKRALDIFVESIKTKLPPLSRVEQIKVTQRAYKYFIDFQIISTDKSGEVKAQIPPDVAICQSCKEELFDKDNRRYGYPFITCTHCGVRYSIINSLPYDRQNTSMNFFEMCKLCRDEYSNPLDRRYHAQPIGCWDCGPKLSLYDAKGSLLDGDIERVVENLLQGDIVAIKGVGGYHLVCDATNAQSIQKLRQRKQRPTKPFAIMVKDLKMAKELAYINNKEQTLLLSIQRPIVLLRAKKLHTLIAPNISQIGLFLPYTPLHLLLLQKLNRPLVATSANVSNEPIATNKDELQKLSNIYDYLLDYNREIVNGCDDSVVMVVREQQIILRRARGYAPVSIKLPFSLEQKSLALGANQKSTVAIGFDNQVILSPHIGDLDSVESVEYFKENIENITRIYDFEPQRVVCDKHPHYESSKYAKENLGELSIQRVQHHYAHILAVMAEKQINSKVLGVSFDGTGYGDDGNLWGGEFLLCDYRGYQRVAHLEYFRLLGGAKAIKEPKRVALSLLFDIYGKGVLDLDTPTTRAFTKEELTTHYIIWQKGLNSPLSSSVGRLFDGVASLRDICQILSFEGESGMMMEEYYDKNITQSYPFEYRDNRIYFLDMIEQILKEPDTTMAISKFFNTLVEMIYFIYKEFDLPLVLSGGVFQNRVLLGLVLDKIPTALIGNQIPPNDGGISLGQIVAK